MDKASVYGTGDCRFESYQDHFGLHDADDVAPGEGGAHVYI